MPSHPWQWGCAALQAEGRKCHQWLWELYLYNWLIGRKNEGIWKVHIQVENWSPVHLFQQLISLTCCLGFRISPSSCNAFPNPEEPGEEDEDVQMERMRTAGAVTALQMNELVLIKTFFLSSANNSASFVRNIPIFILLKVCWGGGFFSLTVHYVMSEGM